MGKKRIGKKRLAALLDAAAKKYEVAEFLIGDPSCFMHKVEGQSNQELMGFIASVFSYGNRQLFFPRIQFFLDVSAGQIDTWLRSGTFRLDVPDEERCFYRLDQWRHVRQFLEGLYALLHEYGTLGEFVQQYATTGLQAVEVLTAYFCLWDVGHLVPKNAKSSCKRICMFLRWMVRDASPVDLGLWSFIDKRTLLIPLDTHVLNQALLLGLVSSRTASMSAVRRLSDRLLEIFPTDPLRADFALFGVGVNAAEFVEE
ncbi:TIGR02757 family protein [Alloprevotella rava]|uniref:Uncharacterized protein (TIGR02757 family) n=1 Tax=Alloprevotella rava TaxID=671218 RepID=A0A7W5UHH7_9BACT|nr:TIGR02757 family protein [Alloprevotella rava]MBB3702601.1 uncharacterized protein (TIGR02757 family) [Alloprevotella rava]